MIIFKNFLSDKLFNSLDKLISSISIDKLEDIFDMSYEKKSTEVFECIPLRLHEKSFITYKAFFVERSILDEFRKNLSQNLDQYKSNTITFQICIWDQESYLTMHYDKIYKYGGTLYLNKNWEESWGGLFEYETKCGKSFSICPQKNLFIFNDCNEKHQVTPISIDANEKRKSIQVWMVD